MCEDNSEYTIISLKFVITVLWAGNFHNEILEVKRK